jgi:hypothetical protein
MHMAGGGDAQGGGWGDARASCASPLGTPLIITYPDPHHCILNFKFSNPVVNKL